MINPRGDTMDQRTLALLAEITPEERRILDGSETIDRNIYMESGENTINAKMLLDAGKQITLRTHTRFIHFPEHRHDYVEVVYMCAGQTTHIVNGKKIPLHRGELLFLSQSATHEVCRAEEGDIAVNFIVLPEFFQEILPTIGEEETPLRRFVMDCLVEKNIEPGYLLFRVADDIILQNLVENLLQILLFETSNRRNLSRMTMTLLFLQLIGRTETLATESEEEELIFRVLRYVEANYYDGSFRELAKSLHYDSSWLSREIKRRTGKTYTQILQEKRMAQAAFLLRNTRRTVADISVSVGYENVSFFHRMFFETFGKSPKNYRNEK